MLLMVVNGKEVSLVAAPTSAESQLRMRDLEGFCDDVPQKNQSRQEITEENS